MKDPITVGVDQFDQAHAEARERLKHNRIGFVLATMNDDLEVELIVCMPDAGDGTLFRMAMVEISRALMIGALRS